jgi:anti-sigma B factor antagonist
MTELARVTVNDEDDLRVVALTGEIDASNVEEVRVETLRDMPNTALGLVLDLRRLTYIDSAGVAFVFEVADRVGSRGQELALVVPPTAVIRRALEVTGVDELATIVPTLEAARTHVLPSNDERSA